MAEETVVETTVEMEARIRKEMEGRLEIWKAQELAALAEKQETVVREEVAKLVKEYQEKQKPLTAEEIQKMVDQEYAEIRIKLLVEMENADVPEKRDFVIRELPQSIEKKFYKTFVSTIKEKSTVFAALAQKNMDQPFEKALVDFMETFEGAFDLMAEAVAIILNPFGKEKDVTAKWVSENVASNRQYSIILAQVEVSKLRDFFSRVFQSGLQTVTTLNRSSRSLRGQ